MAGRVVFVTGGTVGAGHLTRGVAVARALARRSLPSIPLLGPPVRFAMAGGLGYEEVDVAAPEGGSFRDSGLARRLVELAPDLVIVDMFWALVQDVLVDLRCEAWLLVRSAPEAWLIGPPTLPFRPEVWRRVIGIEPIAPLAVREQIAPIVVVGADEPAPDGALRAALGAPSGQPLSVVVHAGLEGEVARLSALAPHARVLDLGAPGARFPIAPLLRQADHVIAAAGYNTFWEAQLLEFAARTTFVPFPRRIDDQARRVRACSGVRVVENGADLLARDVVGR